MKKDRAPAKPQFNFSFDSLQEIILLVMVFITPVIFDRRLGIVFSGTKISWLRAIMVVALAVWAIKLVITRQHRFVRTPLDWPVLSFLFTTTIATITSVHVYTSFAGFYGRFEGLSTWYVYGLLFFLTTNYIRSFQQVKRLIATVLPAATLMAIYGIIQRQEFDPYMWGGVITWQRVIGTIGQPNFLAAYNLMAFFLILALLLEKREQPEKIDWNLQFAPLGYFIFSQLGFIVMIYTLDASDVIRWYIGWVLVTAAGLLFAFTYKKLHPLVFEVLLGICLVLSYICLLYTQSRGGYMGFFAGAVLFAIIAGRHGLFNNWKKISVIAALIVAISAFTMLRSEYSPFARFTGEISINKVAVEETGSQLELKGAAGSRGETWKSAFKVIADYPLFGIGPEVLKMVFPRYETELFRFKETFHVKQDRCHNETFDVPVTKGLISLFLYSAIIFIFFRVGLQKAKISSDSQKLLIAGILAAGLAYLVQNQFSFGVVAITSLFWVLWGMVMVLGEVEQKTEAYSLSAGDLRAIDWKDIPWIPAALVALLAGALVYFSFLSFQSDVYFKSGKTNLEGRNIGRAVDEFTRALQVYPFEGNTISHLGIAYLNMGKAGEAINILKYGNQVDAYNADNFHMLSKVYLSFYDRGMKQSWDDSYRSAQIALKIDPYYAEVYETEGLLFERAGKVDLAVAQYEKAFHANPYLPGPIAKVEELNRKLSRVEHARALFEEANRRLPDNIEVFKVLDKYK